MGGCLFPLDDFDITTLYKFVFIKAHNKLREMKLVFIRDEITNIGDIKAAILYLHFCIVLRIKYKHYVCSNFLMVYLDD